MEQLYKILDEYSIREILEVNSDISNLSSDEIKEKIELLQYINCSDRQIRNIIITNPLFLLEDIDSIKNLIDKLYYLGISNSNYLFSDNPDLLTRGIYSIDSFIENKISNGYTFNDINELIDNDSSIIYN